jgi:hypothetical protein
LNSYIRSQIGFFKVTIKFGLLIIKAVGCIDLCMSTKCYNLLNYNLILLQLN